MVLSSLATREVYPPPPRPRPRGHPRAGCSCRDGYWYRCERAGDILQRLAVYHGEPATTGVPTARKVRAREAPTNCRGRDTQNYAAV